MIQRGKAIPTLAPAPVTKGFVRDWTWFLLKNSLGWVLIAASLVVGPAIPGPGGIPIFLLGFALISFPGKRRLTARILRGRRIRRLPRAYSFTVFVISLLLPAIGATLLLWMTRPRAWLNAHVHHPTVVTLELYLSLALVLWLLLRMAPRGVNLLLPWMPRIRRKIRPWLHDHGIHLLPPRVRHHDEHGHIHYTDSIITLSDHLQARMAGLWLRHRWWFLTLTLVLALAGGYCLIGYLTSAHASP